jgi:hypothetical protein
MIAESNKGLTGALRIADIPTTVDNQNISFLAATKMQRDSIDPMKVISMISRCLPVLSAMALHNGDTINVMAGVIAPNLPMSKSIYMQS